MKKMVNKHTKKRNYKNKKQQTKRHRNKKYIGG